MLRDNPEGSSSRWLSSAGGPSPALHVDGRKSSDDRPSCLENPRPAGAESTLTENASSPFHAEPRHSDATIWPRGRFIDIGGVFHIESFMRALVVKFKNEGIELGLLLKEVGTGRPGSFHL